MEVLKSLIRKTGQMLGFVHPLLAIYFFKLILPMRPNSQLIHDLTSEYYGKWMIRDPAFIDHLNFQNELEGHILVNQVLVTSNSSNLIKTLNSKMPEWLLKDFYQQRRLLIRAWRESELVGNKFLLDLKSFSGNRFKTLKIVDIGDIETKRINVKEVDSYTFSDPIVFPNTAREVRTVAVPPAFVSEVDDVSVVGAFQVVKAQQMIIFEPAAHPKNGIVAGVWRYFDLLNPKKGDVLFDYKPTETKHIENGILISGRATENYFHWMIEYVPKLYNIMLAKIPTDVPLLVKSKLPQQFYECLDCYNLEKRRIIQVDPDQTETFAKHLYIPSISTFHPDNFKIDFWIGGAVSIPHLQFLRDQALSEVKH